MKSLSDPEFVDSPRYAEILATEVPANRRGDAIIALFKARQTVDLAKLKHLISTLLAGGPLKRSLLEWGCSARSGRSCPLKPTPGLSGAPMTRRGGQAWLPGTGWSQAGAGPPAGSAGPHRRRRLGGRAGLQPGASAPAHFRASALGREPALKRDPARPWAAGPRPRSSTGSGSWPAGRGGGPQRPPEVACVVASVIPWSHTYSLVDIAGGSVTKQASTQYSVPGTQSEGA